MIEKRREGGDWPDSDEKKQALGFSSEWNSGEFLAR